MQKVYLLTQTFPLAKGEDTFISPELEALQEKFYVVCVPLEITGEVEYDVDVEYINAPSYSFFHKASALIKVLFQGRVYEEFASIIRLKQNIIKGFLYTIFVSYRANLYSSFLDKNVFQKSERAIVYSYWFNEICLSGVSLMEKYPQYKFITRTHGYDLFDFRNSAGYQPFKIYMDKRLSRVVFACEAAREYYLERYQKEKGEKHLLHYLGVSPQVGISYNATSDTLNLVSCSNAIPLKRIDLIIKGLSLINGIKINWSHFGEGELLDSLKTSAKELLTSPLITYTFYGYAENSRYIDWVKSNNIHLFITCSSTEGGVPVSLSEACSLRIPCIATSVGGIPEIVNDKNGILLPSDPTPDQIKTAITDFYSLSSEEKLARSDDAYMTWQANFNSSVNSSAFAEILSKL